jgi:ribosome biogenesis GTPase / thiamine phosphate phosphatase
MTLHSLGWSGFFQAQLQKTELHPCRVVSEGGEIFLVHDGLREALAMPRGRLRNHNCFPPVVGDWVLAESSGDARYVVESILERRTAIARKQPGRQSAPQVLAANVDRVVLVTSMNQDFSVRRLERYLTLMWESGATPIIVLSKSDLVQDAAPFLHEAETCALGFPVLAISANTGEGLEELRSLMVPGETLALLGSSGVGKSTLANALGADQLRATREVRPSDGKGRHATTDRRLVRLPSGALLIDTPGLREVQLWAGAEAVEQTFAEISELAAHCRFRDCRHQGEPGCAVAVAVAAGEIGAERLDSLHRLRREQERLERERDPVAALEHKRKLKQLFRAFEKQQRQREKR